MKIQQQIAFPIYRREIGGNSYVDVQQYLYFDPALFTGVAAIYFESLGYCYGEQDSVQVQLYNFDTNEEICVLNFYPGPKVRAVSADIKASLTSACKIGVRVKNTGADGDDLALVYSSALTIQQDTTASNKKTASYFQLEGWRGGSNFLNWETVGFIKMKPFNDDCGGVVKNYLELYAVAAGGVGVKFRLYDVTAAAAVANSEVSTNSASFTRLVSGELTLDDSHEYMLQAQTPSIPESFNVSTSFIKTVNEGFYKTAALALNISVGIFGYLTSWNTGGSWRVLDTGIISGGISLSWKFFNQVYHDGEYDVETSFSGYNRTIADFLYDTYHTKSDWTVGTFTYTDVLDPVVLDDEISLAYNNQAIWQIGPACLVAFIEDEAPSGESLPADPTQPSGYHCFMSQFLRNVTADKIPLQTPDGVNKCW